jgi:hypothetical protein
MGTQASSRQHVNMEPSLIEVVGVLMDPAVQVKPGSTLNHTIPVCMVATVTHNGGVVALLIWLDVTRNGGSVASQELM